MIRDYTDHAANERTYLAWVRTALAFMAFGVVIERFDLFVRSLDPAAEASVFYEAAGLVLILLGVVLLGVSSLRYLRFRRQISEPESREFRSARSDLALLFIVGAIGVFMTAYVAYQLLGGA